MTATVADLLAQIAVARAEDEARRLDFARRLEGSKP